MTAYLSVCGYRTSEEPASILSTQIRSELRRKWPRNDAMRNTNEESLLREAHSYA